jgi:hypothetical protein
VPKTEVPTTTGNQTSVIYPVSRSLYELLIKETEETHEQAALRERNVEIHRILLGKHSQILLYGAIMNRYVYTNNIT